MKATVLVLLSAPLLVLLAWSDGRADGVAWSYDFSREPAEIVSGDFSGVSRISLSDELPGQASGSANVLAATFQTFSTTTDGNVNVVAKGDYLLRLALTDEESGETGVLTFGGTLSGSLSATSADVANVFSGETTQRITLGDNEYTVTLGTFEAPGAPDSGVLGSLGARVEVIGDGPDDDGPPINETPEPSALLLCGLGLSGLGLWSWRRRRGPQG